MYVYIYIYIYLLCVCIYGLSATSTLLKLSDTIRIAQLPRDELHAIASHTAVVKSSVWGKLKPSRCRKIYSNIRAKWNSIYIYIYIYWWRAYQKLRDSTGRAPQFFLKLPIIITDGSLMDISSQLTQSKLCREKPTWGAQNCGYWPNNHKLSPMLPWMGGYKPSKHRSSINTITHNIDYMLWIDYNMDRSILFNLSFIII